MSVSEMVDPGMRVVFAQIGDQDTSRIEVVETDEQIQGKGTRWRHEHPGFRREEPVSPVTCGRLLCLVEGSMAEDSGAEIGAALALGEQDQVELDDREEEAREKPAIRVAKIPRGARRRWMDSHLPSHEP